MRKVESFMQASPIRSSSSEENATRSPSSSEMHHHRRDHSCVFRLKNRNNWVKRPSINTWNILCRTGLSCFIYVIHMFTFVEHVKSAVFQVVKDLCGLLAEVLKAGWDVLVHRKPPDLLDHLILPQQVGLHCHRHSAPICTQKLDKSVNWTRASVTLEYTAKVCDAAFILDKTVFTSWKYVCGNKHVLPLVGGRSPAHSTNSRPSHVTAWRDDNAESSLHRNIWSVSTDVHGWYLDLDVVGTVFAV